MNKITAEKHPEGTLIRCHDTTEATADNDCLLWISQLPQIDVDLLNNTVFSDISICDEVAIKAMVVETMGKIRAAKQGGPVISPIQKYDL